MTVDDFVRLYDYSYWANGKLFAVVGQLTPAQFIEPVAGSYGSIRNTLVHAMSAEWGWLDRCGGPHRGPALKADDYPTFDSVATTWSAVERHMRGFLANLKDDDLARAVEFTLPGLEQQTMALGTLLQHAAIHGIHHRGQVTLLLRLLGYTPGNVDLLFYGAREAGAGS